MQTFFRDEMVVRASDLTIPSHDKTLRLISALQQRGDVHIVEDFEPLPWRCWTETHDEDLIRLVANADPAIFDAASIPASGQMVNSIAICAASMLAAATAAIDRRCAFSPTAGFHHAHWSRPGPFCVLNALPLTARHVLNHPSVHSVLILDCDFHRGDGTDDILTRLADDRIHHESLGFRFTRREQASIYMAEIERISNRIESGDFDFVIYQAGMDVLVGDPAGGGILTLAEASERDLTVFSSCCNAFTPIAWNLAGGYQPIRETGYDVVLEGHLNTFDCAVRAFR